MRKTEEEEGTKKQREKVDNGKRKDDKEKWFSLNFDSKLV
jgi:hypothetical protein